MHFVVYFMTKTNHEYPINLPEKFLGLDDVDRIREELGVPGLQFDKIKRNIPELYNSTSIAVDERIARQSGHFRRKPTIVVTVRKEHLNQFCETKLDTVKNYSTGEILSVRLLYQPNILKILAAWEEDGFPKEWGLPKEEEKNE